MTESFVIRNAVKSDLDFIAESIIEAAKSGTDRLFYSKILSLSEEEFTSKLKEILLFDVQGQELNYSSFLVIEIENEKAAACSAWIESDSGTSSSIIRGNLIFDMIERDNLELIKNNYQIIKDVHIDRTAGTLQIESVYVKNIFRGMGLSKKIIEAHINDKLMQGKKFNKVQLQVAKTNENAVKSYLKMGFETIFEKTTDNDLVLNFVPAKTVLLMEKKLNSI